MRCAVSRAPCGTAHTLHYTAQNAVVSTVEAAVARHSDTLLMHFAHGFTALYFCTCTRACELHSTVQNVVHYFTRVHLLQSHSNWRQNYKLSILCSY